MPEDIRVGQNKNKRSIKRSIKANDHNLYTSQTNTSASPLQVSEAKRSKQNKVNKNITPANGNIVPNSFLILQKLFLFENLIWVGHFHIF